MAVLYSYGDDWFTDLHEVAMAIHQWDLEYYVLDIEKYEVRYSQPYVLHLKLEDHIFEILDTYVAVAEDDDQPSECLPKEIKEELTSVLAKLKDFIERRYVIEGERISKEDMKLLVETVLEEIDEEAEHDAATAAAEKKDETK